MEAEAGVGADMMLRAMAEKDGNCYYSESGSPGKCAKLVDSEDEDRNKTHTAS